MGHKLGSGTRIIRLLLLLGVVVALGGVSCCAGIMTSSPDSAEIRNLCLVSIGAFILEGAVCGAVFAMLAARKLLQRVNVMAAALNQCAEGDLTAKIAVVSEDELGMLNLNFNTMLDRLAGMAGKVQGSITELVDISGSIREVSLRGKSAAEIQFEGVSGTSLAVEEINQSVNEVAHAVDGLAKLSADNFSSIVEMSTSMESAMQHVEALSLAVDEVSSAIAALASSEQEIGNGVVSLMEESLATISLVDRMDRTIKLVEQNALQAAAISETVKQDAEDGRESVEATISGIGEIHRSSRITSEAIENLSARAGDIGRILLVIDELSDQTNLLALNASIIAAQAGEHGKGFAVVADEIKGLAKRTSLSTREISEIIDGVQVETGRAVMAIALSEQRIGEGEKLSQRSGAALMKIVASVQMTTSQIGEIARTTAEQSSQSQTMSKSMARVADMVRQIAKATNEQERSSSSIMSAVERMTELSSRVLTSIREQEQAGSRVVRSAEDVTAMIADIRQACGDQTGSSLQIVQEMGNIKTSTHTTMETTQVMEDVVTALAGQIEVLKKEMAGFKVR